MGKLDKCDQNVILPRLLFICMAIMKTVVKYL